MRLPWEAPSRGSAADEGGIAALRLMPGRDRLHANPVLRDARDSVMEVVERAATVGRANRPRRRRSGAAGFGEALVTINIQSGGVADTLKPFVRFNVGRDRMELTDRVRSRSQHGTTTPEAGSCEWAMVLAINNAP